MKIKLELSVEEVNFILANLGNLPYIKSAPLIDKIKKQAEPQTIPGMQGMRQQIEDQVAEQVNGKE